MAFLSININTNKGIFFGQSKIMGTTKTLYEQGVISECRLPTYHEWVETLEKDEHGQPVLPDLGITTVLVEDESEFEESIRAYLDENGEETISELIFDLEKQAFTIDQEVRNQRLKNQIVDRYRDKRNGEIRSAQDRIDQNLREKRMGKTPTLTDEQIATLDNYIQDWVDFKENLDPENPVTPERPDFL